MANWIKGAIKHPGALRAKAKAAHAISPSTGNIKGSFISKAAQSSNPTTRKQANLAKTLSKLRGK